MGYFQALGRGFREFMRAKSIFVDHQCPDCGEPLTKKEHIRSFPNNSTLHCENEECDGL